MPHIITATFKIVTPMFLGGATTNSASDNIRSPSVKGALRFWWRALQWGPLFSKCDNDTDATLTLLHQKETALFGGAAKENEAHGQSLFIIKITPLKKDKTGKWQQKKELKTLKGTQLDQSPDYALTRRATGQAYLLGQGLCSYIRQQGIKYAADKRNRTAILPDQGFQISLILKPQALQSKRDYTKELCDTLTIWGLLGGLGSRSRRGIGSVAIDSLMVNKEVCDIPDNEKSYAHKLTELIRPKHIHNQEPPYSAFSRLSKIQLTKTGNQAWELLNDIGSEFQLYRSWGMSNPNKKTYNQVPYQGTRKSSLKKFKSDHDLLRDVALGNALNNHPTNTPERMLFGLPHNYFFSSIPGGKRDKIVEVHPCHRDDKNKWTSDSRGRRASPLFIHIHSFSNNQALAIQLLLPAHFLPDNDHIEMKGSRGIYHEQPNTIIWSWFNKYFSHFPNGKDLLP